MSLYTPITLVSYAMDYAVFQLDPTGYRIINCLLHVINAGLVYYFVRNLTRNGLVALGTSIVFCIHPVQIESVVWVAERKNVLSSFFFLLTCFSYARIKENLRPVGFAVCGLLFTAACLSKPNVVVAPLLFLVWHLCFDGEVPKRSRVVLAALITVSLCIAIVTIRVNVANGTLRYYGGSALTTAAVMPVVLIRYLELLLFPLNQSLLYFFPAYSFFSPPVVRALALLAVLAAGLFYLWKKEKAYFFWAAWYVILLLPVLNIVPFPSLMNDRYLYLPLIGFFVILFAGFKRFAGAVVTGVFIFFLSCGFVYMNLKRQEIWADPERLWLDTLRTSRDYSQAPYYNLGLVYLRKKQYETAVAHFEKALSIRPRAWTYEGLGLAHLRRGERDEAVHAFQSAIAEDPKSAVPHSNLALVYQMEETYDLALYEMSQAVALDPRNPSLHSNLGSLFVRMQVPEKAEEEYLRALKLYPDHRDALYNLGMLYHARGEQGKAQEYWSRLTKVYPSARLTARVQTLMERVAKA
ncbi:MAG: tetratricopeptide repeat protein [Candidatus Omnitrophota bacterium]|nr:tetratricopeptide repeat protein [Candidatus Omnitrophota bacterium]